MTKALYIHIPFCDQICSYCDFPKIISCGQNIDSYLNALLTELDIYEKTVGFKRLQTIYLGGGTPTVLTVAQLDRLFAYLHKVIDFNRLTEVSIEANPESLNSDEKIDCLVKNGITRISLGVQTFQKNLLKILERNHTKEDVIQVINKLSTTNIEINIDMIYSIPTQTLEQLENDLNTLISLPITHISAYSLILEEHTKFHIDYMKNKLEFLDNDLEATMFEMVINKLSTAGFEHYEISNFTRGNRSYHNETYWKNKPYIAVGLGAHGQLEISPYENISHSGIIAPIPIGYEYEPLPGRVRYENTRSINAYKKALQREDLPVSNRRTLTTDESIEESMFLGLRLLEGVNLGILSIQYQQDIYGLYKEKINKLISLDYVSLENHVLRLNKKGLMMANDVFEAFLL